MQTRTLAVLVAQFSFTRVELEAETNGPARLVNISDRLQAQGDEDVVIASFILTGNTPRKILVRRLAPSPTTFGVSGVARVASANYWTLET